MYEYHLIIKLYDKHVKDEYSLDINYIAFDTIDAESIAKLLTKNIPNFIAYTLFRQDDNLISSYKKQQ